MEFGNVEVKNDGQIEQNRTVRNIDYTNGLQKIIYINFLDKFTDLTEALLKPQTLNSSKSFSLAFVHRFIHLAIIAYVNKWQKITVHILNCEQFKIT